MRGISYVLDANHIKSDNVVQAIQSVNKLDISLNTINHFITETIEIPEGETLVLPDEAVEAKTLLAYIVKVGLDKKSSKFSIDAYEIMRKRAKSLQPTIYANRIPDSVPPTVSAITYITSFEGDSPNTEPVAPVPQDIEPATVVPEVIEPVATPPVKMKGKRNRKIDPNSNLSRAKALYQIAVDKSRDAFVPLLQANLNINIGTATTYYYLAKKG